LEQQAPGCQHPQVNEKSKVKRLMNNTEKNVAIIIGLQCGGIFLNRVLLLKPDLLKDFKRVNVPHLPQVSLVFCPLFPS